MKHKITNLQFLILLFLLITSAFILEKSLQNKEPQKLESVKAQKPLDCSNQEDKKDLLATLTDQPEDNDDLCLFVGCTSFF